MTLKIEDNWELYSTEEFTLRCSLLKDHVNLYQDQEAVWFQKVKLFKCETRVNSINSFMPCAKLLREFKNLNAKIVRVFQ